MSEEDGRRFSLPSIKAQHVAGSSGGQDGYSSHSRTPSTYPPAGPRPNPPTGLYPPGTERGGSSSSATSPSMQNNVISVHTPNNSLSSMPLGTSGFNVLPKCPGNGQQVSQQQQSLQQSSSPTSLFSTFQSPSESSAPSHQGSGDSSNNLFASGASVVWAYVNTLEEKLKLFSDKVLAMEAKEKKPGRKD
ncbi:hypothetical protein DID88_004312 [Monilinia fructigena]|uniref:Uncharacterized protein n=1 Tax=Monilinia fructigena TaxID=38457 RepID=A0A395ITP8_9HELO|nr:hypothetical protein DID88_004312 [Monilinia fructigena]